MPNDAQTVETAVPRSGTEGALVPQESAQVMDVTVVPGRALAPSAERESLQVAFALGGLAGSNAYGAGFLEAAIEENIKPDLISCTTGQLLWVYRYLVAHSSSKSLRDLLADDIADMSYTRIPDIDLLMLMFWGKPDVAKSALPEIFGDMFKNWIDVVEKRMRHMLDRPFSWWQDTSVIKELWSLYPARLLIPALPQLLFENISRTFNDAKINGAKIGIIFNSYDPRNGTEYIHLNERAREILGVKFGETNGYRDGTQYKEITAEHVKGALWLYMYGLEDSNVVDGAYYRQVILSELARAEEIYVARPVNRRWLGAMPKSWIERLDFETEVNFNGSYEGERDRIFLMNRLIKDGTIPQKVVQARKYHNVDFHEVEIDTQRGFFNYCFEDVDVFDRAKKQAQDCFRKHRGPAH